MIYICMIYFFFLYVSTHTRAHTHRAKKLWVHTIAYLEISPKFIYTLFTKKKIETWRKQRHDLMQL